MKFFLGKIIFIVIISGMVTEVLNAQNVLEENTFKKFVKYYNQDQPDSLFRTYDILMKKAFSLDKTVAFIKTTKRQIGAIKKYSFSSYDEKNRQIVIYKTQFENIILNTHISINEKGQIRGLFLKPYIPKVNSYNKNALNNIPNVISSAIYKNIKMLHNKIQLSISIIKNGKIDYYGIIIKNDSLKNIQNKDKIFEIGSITKIFTSTILSSFVVDKTIKLRDNINSYFDFSFANDIKIRFLDLANHTSNLPRLPSNFNLTDININNPYQSYNEKLLKEYLKNDLQNHKQKIKKYEYSNLGAGLLLYALSISQNQSFDSLFKKKIFDRYQMVNTYTSRLGLKNDLVKSYDEKGNEIINWDFGILFGAGGILSSVSDLSKFIVAHFSSSNKELTLTRKITVTVNDNMKIGLGLHMIKLDNKQEVYWHNGGTGGYSSSLAFDVNKKNGVIILSNLSVNSPYNKNIDQLCFEIIKLLN